jgi:hypothetical protein
LSSRTFIFHGISSTVETERSTCSSIIGM